MKIRPLNDQVLVLPDPQQTETASGIVLVTKTPEKSLMGTVMAVSDKVEIVKVGDRVLYGKYAGTDVELPGKKNHLVVDQKDLLGVIEDE